jgi:hypothetical protein
MLSILPRITPWVVLELGGAFVGGGASAREACVEMHNAKNKTHNKNGKPN